jgi:hypothetical protein
MILIPSIPFFASISGIVVTDIVLTYLLIYTARYKFEKEREKLRTAIEEERQKLGIKVKGEGEAEKVRMALENTVMDSNIDTREKERNYPTIFELFFLSGTRSLVLFDFLSLSSTALSLASVFYPEFSVIQIVAICVISVVRYPPDYAVDAAYKQFIKKKFEELISRGETEEIACKTLGIPFLKEFISEGETEEDAFKTLGKPI